MKLPGRISSLRPKPGHIIPVVLVAVAAWLRLWQLTDIPPGLHHAEASVGLEAMAGKFIPSLLQAQQSLTTLLTGIVQRLTPDRITGVRLASALAGAAGVVFYYRWLSRTYGTRIARIGTVFMAVLPWPLYLTRFGGGYGLAMLFMSVSLYLLATSWQRRGSRRAITTIVVLAAGLYTHPSYNWFALGVVLATAANTKNVAKFRRHVPTRLVIGLLVFLLAAAPAAPSVVAYAVRLVSGLSGTGSRLMALGPMFNLRAPADAAFNLASLPLLNAFAGLMLILGLLFTFTSLKRPANRTLLVLFFTGLTAFVLLPSALPLADRTLVLLIPSITLAALGTDYLLGQWLKTFPQNAAARQVGTLMLVVLMFFSARHSFNQYFLAWRASTQTKQVYNRPAVEAAKLIGSQSFDGRRFFVGGPGGLAVAEYLTKDIANIELVSPQHIKNTAKDKQAKQFIILPDAKDQAIAELAKKFPGGKLKPQLDSAKQELFLIYTVKP